MIFLRNPLVHWISQYARRFLQNDILIIHGNPQLFRICNPKAIFIKIYNLHGTEEPDI